MIPASVAIERAGIDVDVSDFEGVAFEIMPRWMRATVGSRIEGMTLGARIFLAEDVFEAVVIGERPDLVAHELVHVAQWREGAVTFVLRYLSDYLQLRILGLPHHAAYLGISYEAAAYEVSRSHGWSPG
ncbi:MAG: DUF4157 domain-containing protein [Armatimonadetes bacterium]|nr:MAG: DUF4157 domain-containing protein [Armatimonadota bacterium]